MMIIRWLEMFGKHGKASISISDRAVRELNPGRPLAAECIVGSKTGYLDARLGLLVDTDKTKLVACYDHDVYSHFDRYNGAVELHEYETGAWHVNRWHDIDWFIDMVAEEEYKIDRKYGNIRHETIKEYRDRIVPECIIEKPVYKRVIVIADYANKPIHWTDSLTTMEKAHIVSDIMGIPIHVSHSIEYPYEVRTRGDDKIVSFIKNKEEWKKANKHPRLRKWYRVHW